MYKLLHLIIIATLHGLACNVASAVELDKPLNLLVVTADDMNADSGGWNGGTLGATPNLDAFAKSSFRFVNSHVTVPRCHFADGPEAKKRRKWIHLGDGALASRPKRTGS